MAELRFDGRTAIVTGAGGEPGLGRAFALLLAARGARVVVNDVGTVPEMPYRTPADAEAVVAQIRAGGGEALADAHDISTVDGAEALVATARDAFGSVDILVNNAAICLLAPFDVLSARHFDRHVAVNLTGAVRLARAAWPHMKAAGYGRIVNIGSSALVGVRLMSAYGTAKGGLFALTQALAAEGQGLGIRVNTVNPTAFSRMVPALQNDTSVLFEQLREHYPAEAAAPLVAFLAHEDCPVSGECFDTAGGRVARTIVSQTAGFTQPGHDVETIAARWAEVMDPAGARIMEGTGFDSSQWDLRPYDPEA